MLLAKTRGSRVVPFDLGAVGVSGFLYQADALYFEKSYAMRLLQGASIGSLLSPVGTYYRGTRIPVYCQQVGLKDVGIATVEVGVGVLTPEQLVFRLNELGL